MIKNIGVIGVGKLGLSFALLCASKGYNVCGSDINEEYIDSLKNKTCRTTEPQIEQLLQECTTFYPVHKNTTVVASADIIFLFVPTPSKENGEYDHQYIEQAIESIRDMDMRGKILVIGCTTMPGYTQSLIDRLEESKGVTIVYNPEFIAQGDIINGLKRADMVLVGTHSESAAIALQAIYRSIMDIPLNMKVMSPTAAEITKISINCFLTMKIAYANMIGEIAINSGIEQEVDTILTAIGDDSRIGNKFLKYGYGYGGPCVLPTQDIITDRGVIQIKDIQVGDRVLTHTGFFNEVTEIFKTPYDGVMHKFKLEGYSSDELVITPDHPIYASHRIGSRYYQTGGKQKLTSMTDKQYDKLKPSFIPAGKLQHGDFFAIPRLQPGENELAYIHFSSHHKSKFPTVMELTPDMMRLFGYWLAEGHTWDGKHISFTFNKSETFFHEDVIQLMDNCFNLKTTHRNGTGPNTTKLRSTSQRLAKFLNETFGKGAAGKKVPMEWVTLSPDHLINLMRGMWYGDGSHSTGVFSYTTISKELFTFNKLILYRLGIAFTTQIGKAKTGSDGVKHKQFYTIKIAQGVGIETLNSIIPMKAMRYDQDKRGNKKTCFWKDNIMFYHVKSREDIQYKGYVYNIEVENDHSYMLSNSVVHNCLPRDMRALGIHARSVYVQDDLEKVIDDMNMRHHYYLIHQCVRNNPSNKVPFIFTQLSYKKGTEMLVESQQYRLCKGLLSIGYKVVIHESPAICDIVAKELEVYNDQITFNQNIPGYKIEI